MELSFDDLIPSPAPPQGSAPPRDEYASRFPGEAPPLTVKSGKAAKPFPENGPHQEGETEISPKEAAHIAPHLEEAGLTPSDIDPNALAVAHGHAAAGEHPADAYERAVIETALSDPKVKAINDGQTLPDAPISPPPSQGLSGANPSPPAPGASVAQPGGETQVSAMGESALGGTPAAARGIPALTFDDLIPKTPSGLENTGNESWLSGAAKGGATALIKGVSNSLGTVGNLSDFANYLVARGESAITGRPYEDVAKEHAARQAQMEDNNPLLKYTNPRNLFPSGAEISGPILSKTGEYVPSSEVGKMAQSGLEAATGMVGPGGGAVADGAKLGQALIQAPLEMAPGNVASGAIGQGVTDVTGDPLAGMAAGTIVPGAATLTGKAAHSIAKPFLAGLPGDIFQGTREGMVANRLSEVKQNQERLDALRKIAPPGADTMNVSDGFQAHLDNITNATSVAVDQLKARAQELASSLGPGLTPEEAGAAIRTGIEAARDEAKAARRTLYNAVDPDQKLTIVSSPIRDAAEGIKGAIGQYAEPPAGKEASILADAAKIPGVMKFHDIMDFDQRLTAAMSEERRAAGETPAWARMSRLKGAVQDTINKALENQAASDKQSVERGDLAPGQTMEARVRQNWETPDAANVAGNAVGYQESNLGASPRSASTSVGASGADVSAGGRFSETPGSPGVSAPAPPEPNFDEAAAGRLAEAKSAHAQYARTYREGPVAPILKTQGFKDNYTLPASAVPARAVVPGDRGYQTTKAFLEASKGDHDVLSALTDYALNPLRSSLRADGTVDPQKFAAWQKKYAGSLRAIDEASPGFSNKYSNAADATDELVRAGFEQKKQLADFEKTAAAKFVGKTDPVEVENQLGDILKKGGPTQMQELVTKAKTLPEESKQAVLDGLHKAGVDWMVREYSKAVEAPGASERSRASTDFRNFLINNHATLAELYPEKNVQKFREIADELQKTNRRAAAKGIRATPDMRPKSLLGVFLEGAGAHYLGVPSTALGAAAVAYGLRTLRSAGLNKVEDMFRDALLNPDLANTYLSKSPQRTEGGSINALARAVRRSLIAQPVVGAASEPPKH